MKPYQTEFRKRVDGLYNKWEQIHPGVLFHDITIFETDEITGWESQPIWVVTDVVSQPPRNDQ